MKTLNPQSKKRKLKKKRVVFRNYSLFFFGILVFHLSCVWKWPENPLKESQEDFCNETIVQLGYIIACLTLFLTAFLH